MSHINDLIGVARGLRLVVEASTKMQQEACSIMWNNSSIRPLLQQCPTNPLTAYKPSADTAKDVIERAVVVAHGLRKYVVMNVPNLNPDIEGKVEMDPKLQQEIEELNREFNRTFATLEQKVQNKDSPAEFVSPLENIKMQPEPSRIEKDEVKTEIPKFESVKPKFETLSNTTQFATQTIPKPVAKKKIRVSVSFALCFFLSFIHLLRYETEKFEFIFSLVKIPKLV